MTRDDLTAATGGEVNRWDKAVHRTWGNWRRLLDSDSIVQIRLRQGLNNWHCTHSAARCGQWTNDRLGSGIECKKRLVRWWWIIHCIQVLACRTRLHGWAGNGRSFRYWNSLGWAEMIIVCCAHRCQLVTLPHSTSLLCKRSQAAYLWWWCSAEMKHSCLYGFIANAQVPTSHLQTIAHKRARCTVLGVTLNGLIISLLQQMANTKNLQLPVSAG